jgi:4-amino-4-deoxy-L-arabinose transferase-like glycosyltransferase
LAALLGRSKTYDDARVRFLALWMLYGLLFFSISRNKLPGYVLPLLPALAIVLAVAVEKVRGAEWWLGACGLLLIAIPMIAHALPDALLSGVRKSHLVFAPGLPFAAVAVVAWWLAWKEKQTLAILGIALVAMAGLGVPENPNVARAGPARLRPQILARESGSRCVYGLDPSRVGVRVELLCGPCVSVV